MACSYSAAESITHSSGNKSGLPDLRIIHFNDVYHVDPSSAEPVGGVARFQTLCKYYRSDEKFKGQPRLLTFFSGDAFNPSLESSVTKGWSPFCYLLLARTACEWRKDCFLLSRLTFSRSPYGPSVECRWYRRCLRWSKRSCALTLSHSPTFGLAHLTLLSRITILTLESLNFVILRVNVNSLGCLPTSSILVWVTMYLSAMPKRPSCLRPRMGSRLA